MRSVLRVGSLAALAVALQLNASWAGAARSRAASASASTRKFARVASFSRRLPEVRRDVSARLASPALDQDTAVAAIVRIMDTTYMRVGSERYARRAKPSFGAASLRKEHVVVRGDEVSFDFIGKSRVHWQRSVRDRELARAVRVFLAGPGDRLFQLEGGDAVTEGDVRSYLGAWGGQPKDLRTHHANRLLDQRLARLRGPPSQAKLALAIAEVARALGHTPAVSRRSYLDPLRIERYLAAGKAPRDRDHTRRSR